MLELRCKQKFTMGSSYDYSKQIEITLLQSIPIWVKSRCSIKKILRSICNMLKINPMQCCLLAWLLSKSKFQINIATLNLSTKIKIFQDEFDHKVLLFILMNAYYVKNYLCGQIEGEIDKIITSQIPNFLELYNKKFNPEKSLKTLALSDVNKLFNEWTCRQTKKSRMDYNTLVDKILYLSKTYNVNGNNDGKNQIRSQKLGVPKKKRKVQSVQDDGSSAQKSEEIASKNEYSRYSSIFEDYSKEAKNSQFKFMDSLEQQDFLGHSLQNASSYKMPEIPQNNQSRRTTRNMLQSVNVHDYIPSQDNLFNSQISSLSNNFFPASQNSAKHSSQSKRNLRSSSTNKFPNMKLKQTDSFEQLK